MMFGFGERAKLKRMGEELKGASLQEVVEKFADSKLIQRPLIAYDEKVALIYKESIDKDKVQNAERFAEIIQTITSSNNLEDGSFKIYLAYHTSEMLRGHAIDLTLATKLIRGTDEVVDYLFNSWLKTIPTYYVLPVLFPAKCGGRIEDFAIDRGMRTAMIDGLFARLKRAGDFARLVNAFAEDHPYFRHYPL